LPQSASLKKCQSDAGGQGPHALALAGNVCDQNPLGSDGTVRLASVHTASTRMLWAARIPALWTCTRTRAFSPRTGASSGIVPGGQNCAEIGQVSTDTGSTIQASFGSPGPDVEMRRSSEFHQYSRPPGERSSCW